MRDSHCKFFYLCLTTPQNSNSSISILKCASSSLDHPWDQNNHEIQTILYGHPLARRVVVLDGPTARLAHRPILDCAEMAQSHHQASRQRCPLHGPLYASSIPHPLS